MSFFLKSDIFMIVSLYSPSWHTHSGPMLAVRNACSYWDLRFSFTAIVCMSAVVRQHSHSCRNISWHTDDVAMNVWPLSFPSWNITWLLSRSHIGVQPWSFPSWSIVWLLTLDCSRFLTSTFDFARWWADAHAPYTLSLSFLTWPYVVDQFEQLHMKSEWRIILSIITTIEVWQSDITHKHYALAYTFMSGYYDRLNV